MLDVAGCCCRDRLGGTRGGLLTRPHAGAEPALDLADGSSADRTVTVTLQRASLNAGLRIENRSGKRLHVRIVATPLRGTDGQAVATTWERHADGASVGVSNEPFELGPYVPVDLAVRADLVRAGTYASQVSLFAKEQPNGPEQHQRTIALTLNREVPTGWSAPPGAGQDRAAGLTVRRTWWSSNRAGLR